MTEQSKTKKQLLNKTLVGALLTFSVVGYLFSDVQSYYNPTNKSVIRSVNGVDITIGQIIRERDAMIQNFGSIPQDRMMKQQILQQAMDNVTMRTALSEYAKKMGVRASDIEVGKIIQSIPAFYGTDGQFDSKILKRILMSQGISLKAFKKNISDNIIRDNFTNPIISEFPLSQKIENSLDKFAFTNIELTAYQVDYDKLPENIKKVTPPTETQLKQLYTEKKGFLTRPALKNIQYAVFNADTLQDKINVKDTDITDFYNQQKASLYQIPEKRKVLQIVVPKEKDALNLYQELTNGSDFKTIAKKIGYAETDIDLGFITAQDISDKEAQKKIFSSKADSVIPPIKTDFGFTIYGIQAIQPATVKAIDSVREEIKDKLLQKKLSQYLSDIIPKIDDDLAGGADLSEITQKYGSKILEQKNITPNGVVYNSKTHDNPDIVTEKLNPLIPLDDVNQYNVGDDIPVIPVSDSEFILMKITHYQPERPLDFSESKETLNNQDILTQKNTILKSILDDLKKTNAKQDFAQKHNIKSKHYTIHRNEGVPKDIYYPEFNQIIFAKTGNEVLSHIDDNSATMLVVNAINFPDDVQSKSKDTFNDQLQKNYDMIIQNEALNMIRNITDIKTYDSVLNDFIAREID